MRRRFGSVNFGDACILSVLFLSRLNFQPVARYQAIVDEVAHGSANVVFEAVGDAFDASKLLGDLASFSCDSAIHFYCLHGFAEEAPLNSLSPHNCRAKAIHDCLRNLRRLRALLHYSVEVGSKVAVNNEHAFTSLGDAPEPQLNCVAVDVDVDVEEPKFNFHGQSPLTIGRRRL